MSGSDTGLATSEALCAIASEISRSGESPASRLSPVSDRAAVKARRVMIKADSRIGAFTPERTKTRRVFASLKRQLWQWRASIPVRSGSLNFA